MSARRSRRQPRTWFLVLLAPALLLGPVTAGGALLVHAHGEEQVHAHFVSEPGHGHREHARGHATAGQALAERAAHDHAPADEPHRSEPREGGRFVLASPGPFQAPASGATRPADPMLRVALHFPAERDAVAVIRPRYGGAGPPGIGKRTGIAAVLATSRALLI